MNLPEIHRFWNTVTSLNGTPVVTDSQGRSGVLVNVSIREVCHAVYAMQCMPCSVCHAGDSQRPWHDCSHGIVGIHNGPGMIHNSLPGHD